MKRVMIDPGHGGQDPGAVGPALLAEKDVALAVGEALWKKLSRHPEVVAKLTRETDEFVPLKERAARSNAFEADLFISIHCNASESHQGKGFEVWTSPGETASDRAATQSFNRYQEAFPARRARVGLGDGDVDKEAKFTVLTKTKGPALLFELEFIDNSEGEEFLALTSPGALAQPLYRGALDFFGLKEEREERGEGVDPQAVSVLEILEALALTATALKAATAFLEEARTELSKSWTNM